jgi:hypothetical protein
LGQTQKTIVVGPTAIEALRNEHAMARELLNRDGGTRKCESSRQLETEEFVLHTEAAVDAVRQPADLRFEDQEKTALLLWKGRWHKPLTTTATTHMTVEGKPVDDSEIGRLLGDLASAPLGLGEDEDFRISIAGAA